jgi:fructose-1-phosphate kinase PfkB-like protein
LYAASGHAWRLHVPTLAVKNAIGAGDVCTAIFLHELAVAARANGGWGSVDGETAAEAFAWGLAAACARCMHETLTDFTREEALAMRQKIRIEKVESA